MSGRILSEWINRQIKCFPVLPVQWMCWCCCPHTSQAPDGVCRQRGKDTCYTVNFILFLLSPAERALLTPSTPRQVKCAVFRQLLPLLSISPQGHQTLEARSGVPQSGSHKQVVPSAHCGCPPSTSTTLPHSFIWEMTKKGRYLLKKERFSRMQMCFKVKIDTSGHGNFVRMLF